MNSVDKKKFPHLYMYRKLGGYKTNEGNKFELEHRYDISNERFWWLGFREYRRNILGGDKKIHIPETVPSLRS